MVQLAVHGQSKGPEVDNGRWSYLEDMVRQKMGAMRLEKIQDKEFV
jgi:hypothetical protein